MKRILLLFFMLGALFGWSQPTTTVSDLEGWTEIGVRKEMLDDQLDIGLSQNFRFNQNSSQLNQYFTEISLDYTFFSHLELGGGYRFIRDRTGSGDFQNEYRLFGDLGYKHEIDRFDISGRFRVQRGHVFEKFRDQHDHPTDKIRFKIETEYNIKDWKWDPYLGVELFWRKETVTFNYIDQVTESNDYQGTEKIRFTLGTSKKFKKLGKFDAFYRIEREFDSYPTTFEPATYYIIGAKFRFDF